ncbi:MAG: hypothetical protein WAT09_14640 [Paracoccaceae bacterium]
MQDITELERRISSALERIGKGLDRLNSGSGGSRPAPPAVVAAAVPVPVPVAAAVSAAPAAGGGDAAALRAKLEEERTTTAQLQERLRAVKDKDLVLQSQLQEKVEKLTRQLDVQGLELQRMRKTAVTLREQLRQLREAQAAGVAEPHLINKSMLAELDALRATRLTELAELDEIAAALDPHLTEAENA